MPPLSPSDGLEETGLGSPGTRSREMQEHGTEKSGNTGLGSPGKKNRKRKKAGDLKARFPAVYAASR